MYNNDKSQGLYEYDGKDDRDIPFSFDIFYLLV